MKCLVRVDNKLLIFAVRLTEVEIVLKFAPLIHLQPPESWVLNEFMGGQQPNCAEWYHLAILLDMVHNRCESIQFREVFGRNNQLLTATFDDLLLALGILNKDLLVLTGEEVS